MGNVFRPTKQSLLALTCVLGGALVAPAGAADRPTTQSANQAAKAPRISVIDLGAVADDKTVNTAAIQRGIDTLSAGGGGTLVVPRGVFVSGAIFFKPGVDLLLEKEAVLKCSADVAKDFPAQRTRIEGLARDKFTPALINADGCDGLQITGEGTLDGDGRPLWDLFWTLRRAAPDPKNFPNISIPRARLAFIQNSKNVVVRGLTFKDSQFWNLHVYKCQALRIENVNFSVPDDYKQAPSTDGIDVDSCQDVTISGCYFSVTDDCIALKGSKGPLALEDKDSPPVEHVRVSDCTFKRGNSMLTIGSEASVVRDVVVERCRGTGPVTVAVFKLRSDTPQHYEDIHYRDITVDDPAGTLVSIMPWGQYIDLKGHAPPPAVVTNVTLSNIKGRCGSFGSIRPNPGQTDISDISFEDVDLRLKNADLRTDGVKNLKLTNVKINGKLYTK